MSLLFDKGDVLLVNTKLASLIGLNEAIVLQQLHYWLRKKVSGVDHEGQRWVFNTIEDWHKQFPFWSADTIKRTLMRLRKVGLIDAKKLSSAGRDRTNYYTIAYGQLALMEAGNLPQCIGANCPNGSVQSAPMDRGNLPQSFGADCPNDILRTKTSTETSTETSTKTSLPAQLSPAAVAPVSDKKSSPQKVKAEAVDEAEQALQQACRATWAAYKTAFLNRYGVDPVRNAPVNAKVKQLVQRLGYEEAPQVAQFYVERVVAREVMAKTHDVGMLLMGAESYRTQWATGRVMTRQVAAQQEQVADVDSTFEHARELLRQRRQG